MRFTYRAYDATGALDQGAIQADTKAEAVERLRAAGLLIEAISTESAPRDRNKEGSRFALRLGGPSRLKTLTSFAKQLAVLTRTGTPLVDALRALERQCSDPEFKKILKVVVNRVEQGGSLSEAMQDHPRWFDPVCRSLVSAGESGGKMEQMLERLAQLLRQQQHVRSSLIGAMVYPVLLIFVAGGVLGLMLLFVLPRFAGLFETLDMALPPTTRIMMAISNLLRGYWWLLLGALASLATGAYFAVRSPAGRRAFDVAAIRLPYLGDLVKRFATARLARLLGVLLDSKVPLLDSLALTRLSCSNVCYRNMLQDTENAVEKGDSLSGAFFASRLVEPSLCEALRNAERSGTIGSVLTSVADYLDQENDIVIRSLTGIIEPIILIVLGALVGLVAVSMFMPLFDLTAMTQTGG